MSDTKALVEKCLNEARKELASGMSMDDLEDVLAEITIETVANEDISVLVGVLNENGVKPCGSTFEGAFEDTGDDWYSAIMIAAEDVVHPMVQRRLTAELEEEEVVQHHEQVLGRTRWHRRR